MDASYPIFEFFPQSFSFVGCPGELAEEEDRSRTPVRVPLLHVLADEGVRRFSIEELRGAAGAGNLLSLSGTG